MKISLLLKVFTPIVLSVIAIATILNFVLLYIDKEIEKFANGRNYDEKDHFEPKIKYNDTI